LRERGETDDEGSKSHQSLVYTEDGASGSRSSVKTLVLAVLILAALSLAVWGGLEWYKRRTGQKPGPPGTGRLVNYQTAVAANSTVRSNNIPTSERMKEGEHDFTV